MDSQDILEFLHGPAERRASAISLTPLIDVVFILLLFFMLTSTFVRQKQLELSSLTSSATAVYEKPQQVELNPAGEYRLLGHSGGYVAIGELLDAVDLQLPTVLRPAGEASVQQVVAALNQLKSAGLSTIRLGQVSGSSESSVSMGGGS